MVVPDTHTPAFLLWCHRNGKAYIRLLCICINSRESQAGIIKFKTSIIKGGVEKFALKQPIFLVSGESCWNILALNSNMLRQPSPVDPLYSAKVSQSDP